MFSSKDNRLFVSSSQSWYNPQNSWKLMDFILTTDSLEKPLENMDNYFINGTRQFFKISPIDEDRLNVLIQSYGDRQTPSIDRGAVQRVTGLVLGLCQITALFHWFTVELVDGSVLDRTSLPPVFESRRGHNWRLFHLWLRLITFGRRSAHLVNPVHKSGRKTSIIVIIIIIELVENHTNPSFCWISRWSRMENLAVMFLMHTADVEDSSSVQKALKS